MKDKKSVVVGWHCYVDLVKEPGQSDDTTFTEKGQVVAVDDYGVVIKTPKYESDKEMFIPWNKVVKIVKRKD